LAASPTTANASTASALPSAGSETARRHRSTPALRPNDTETFSDLPFSALFFYPTPDFEISKPDKLLDAGQHIRRHRFFAGVNSLYGANERQLGLIYRSVASDCRE
jgi:hypothetical protein